MGNLRDKYTSEEWDEIENRIKTDRINGKPDTNWISVHIDNLSLERLITLRDIFEDMKINSYGLDNWIEYRTNYGKD